MKTCGICKAEKARAEFGKNSARPDGLDNRCRVCRREYDRIRGQRPDVRKQRRDYSLNRLKTNESYRLRQTLRRCTPDDYRRMLEEQGGGCAICNATSSDNRGHRLHVDHDHATGKVRGLLCKACNTALGNFKDNTDLMAKAIEYLERNNGD